MRLDAVNTQTFRFEVLRGNAVYCEIYPADESAEVQFVESSELKTSMRGNFYLPPADVDFLTDRLRPVAVINGVDYPCGVFVITSEQRVRNGGRDVLALEGYSLLYLAKQKRLEERKTLNAGVRYTTWIMLLLQECGIDRIKSKDASDYTFSVTRADWEIGTPYLDIVNELLTEIGYRPAWVDQEGYVWLSRAKNPSLEDITDTYSAGEYSVIESGYTKSTDRYGKANVFRVVCDSPDLEEPMVAVAENNVESSPFSVGKMGRILHTEQIDGIPSQEALQEYADRLRDESLQTEEIVEITTALLPERNAYDVVGLDHGELAGLYTEVEWRIPMMLGGSMYHKLRRVYA